VKRYTRGLSGSAKGEAQADIESFFEDELRVSKGEFESFLNILDQYLDEGLSFKIFLKGFASPLASDTYNYNLGQRRISTIQNEFKLTHGGSLQKYFESGDLEVTEKSFGEETAPSSVSDDIRNLRKSIYSPEASRERRVEIIEIQKDSPEK
jgi:outer membrane protein OmpA-like peptidoglycan-associated protein